MKSILFSAIVLTVGVGFAQQAAACATSDCATEETVITTPQGVPCDGANCAHPGATRHPIARGSMGVRAPSIPHGYPCSGSDCARPEPTVTTPPQACGTAD